jgi:VanZ family protein
MAAPVSDLARSRSPDHARVVDVVLWLAAVGSTIWVIVASLGPAPGILNAFRLADKVFHALHYTLLTFLFLLAAAWRPGRRGAPHRRAAALVVVSALVLGAAIEVIQGHVGRHADVLDFLADAVGVFLGLAAWVGVRRLAVRRVGADA